MRDAQAAIEDYRRDIVAALDAARDFVRSAQAIGPRRAPGPGGFAWQEPSFTRSGVDTLRLRWEVGERSIAVDFQPGNLNSVRLYRVNGSGQGRGEERGVTEALEEVCSLMISGSGQRWTRTTS